MLINQIIIIDNYKINMQINCKNTAKLTPFLSILNLTVLYFLIILPINYQLTPVNPAANYI